MLQGPELLLLDEPLTALDAELKERIVVYLERMLAELRIPTMLVSHDLARCATAGGAGGYARGGAGCRRRGGGERHGHPGKAELGLFSREDWWRPSLGLG